MFGILNLRLHHVALAEVSMISICLVGILHYGHGIHGCDLLYWRQMLARLKDKPMAIMLLIGVLKLLMILIRTLLSYTEVPQEIGPPISIVKRRYRRFIVMRLLAAHKKFLRDKRQIQQRHSDLLQAIHLFRKDGRRLYECTADQLSQSIQQLLPAEEQQELDLLQLGYDRYKCVSQLREMDIYKLVLALALPKL
ncbi:uncharacterized protein LOC6558170 [Drosophila grimshawi]|uniref:GH16584 n=1 Tax=Drosophila grimshawi TaxID=7222 RepID=B4J239_DROGR|nr:uncharacterized protein LOC6558170 [Drosophila grimshawi]EDV96990.1 GH16584 [Drosophila grimshawi]